MVFDTARQLLKRYQYKEDSSICVSEQKEISFAYVEEKLKESLLTSLAVSLIYILDPSEVDAAVSHLLSRQCVLGLDIETFPVFSFRGDKLAGLDPRKSDIRLVQLYDGADTVFVFDLLKLGGVASLGSHIWDRPMVAHNAMFEMKHLLHKGVYPKRLGCTLLCDRVINGNRRELREDLGLSRDSRLKDLSKELLCLDVSKELQTSDWSQESLSEAQIEYAGLDAVLVVRLFNLQRETIKKEGLTKSYELLRDAQYPVAMMELTGIGFDVDNHKKAIEGWCAEAEELRVEIETAIGRGMNLNSGKQVGEWLREALTQEDLEAWSKTPKGQLCTNTHVFKLNEGYHPVFARLIEYRRVAKLISSFGDSMYKFIDVSEKRLYGSFSLGTTATGRMASNKPNMQNMPRSGFRHLFCARDGYTLIGLDYSQQELRVAALVSQDPALLRVYEEGEDAHRITAAMVLGLPKDQVTKEHRQLAKALNFGLLYGQGAKGLADYAKRNYGVELTTEEAERHRKRFFSVYKALRKWQRSTGDIVKITEKVRTPTGRLRDFSRESVGYRYTAALNHPIQGAAAEITLTALVKLAPLLCDDCRLVNVIHDEILLEVRDDLAQDYAPKVVGVMEQAFVAIFPESTPYLKGLVEIKTGKTWADTK